VSDRRGERPGIPGRVASYSAVVTTGIYCGTGCASRPLTRNRRSYEFAAAAEAAGFRPCLRCRPYRQAIPVRWAGPELVCRGIRLIIDGALDERTEASLGAMLGVSERHLRRLFLAHAGVTPDELARSVRTHFARRLLDDTDLAVADIAFAAGFGSVRQLNRSCQEVFRATPTQLRARRRKTDRLIADGGLLVRLAFNGELDWPAMTRQLAICAIPGVEDVTGGAYRRTITVDGDPGVLELLPGGPGYLLLRLHLSRWAGLIHVVGRARRIAGLDDDMAGAIAGLRQDPVIGPLIATRPGIRVPGTWDPFETGVLAIIAQQAGPAAATAAAGRLARRLGTPVPGLRQLNLTHTFPPPAMLAADLTSARLTKRQAAAVRSFASAIAAGQIRLDRSMSLDALVSSVTAIAGIGPAAAQALAWRMGEPDAFPCAPRAGLLPAEPNRQPSAGTGGSSSAGSGQQWRPWRALALAHLRAAGLAPEPARRLIPSARPPV
jgi:AraC family transcriptional regulator, regulatory protein of adaptative response / DNA-3-methyladenine glycosylase II